MKNGTQKITEGTTYRLRWICAGLYWAGERWTEDVTEAGVYTREELPPRLDVGGRLRWYRYPERDAYWPATDPGHEHLADDDDRVIIEVAR